jgi:hypothetical protein
MNSINNFYVQDAWPLFLGKDEKKDSKGMKNLVRFALSTKEVHISRCSYLTYEGKR